MKKDDKKYEDEFDLEHFTRDRAIMAYIQHKWVAYPNDYERIVICEKLIKALSAKVVALSRKVKKTRMRRNLPK